MTSSNFGSTRLYASSISSFVTLIFEESISAPSNCLVYEKTASSLFSFTVLIIALTRPSNSP